MKNPFTRKPAQNATSAAKVHADVMAIIQAMPLADKMRIAAGIQTGGALEMRLRMHPDGARKLSVWLYAEDGEGFELASGGPGEKP